MTTILWVVLVVVGVIAYILGCGFFGGYNARLQWRRHHRLRVCSAENKECIHQFMADLGNWIWPVALPGTLLAEAVSALYRLGRTGRVKQ